MVLGRAAQHGGASDVDVLDRFLERYSRPRDGFLERIEVHHHEVDGLDLMLPHRRLVGRIAAPIQQPAMHFRMQGLDPPVQHLRKPGETAQVGHG